MYTFGDHLKALRINKNFTQKELADDFNSKYGYSVNTTLINQFEDNKRTPELDSLIDFAKYFNVSIEFFLGLDLDNEDIV